MVGANGLCGCITELMPAAKKGTPPVACTEASVLQEMALLQHAACGNAHFCLPKGPRPLMHAKDDSQAVQMGVPHCWWACCFECSPWLLCRPLEALCHTQLRHPRQPFPTLFRPAASHSLRVTYSQAAGELAAILLSLLAIRTSKYTGSKHSTRAFRDGYLHDSGDATAAARSAPGVLSEVALAILGLHCRADPVLRIPDRSLKAPPDPAVSVSDNKVAPDLPVPSLQLRTLQASRH